MVRILVANDFTLLREALCEALVQEGDFEVVAEVGDAESVITQAVRTRADVVLLELHRPVQAHVRTARGLLLASPGSRVVILNTCEDPAFERDMLAAGIARVLDRNVSRQDLVDAIREVAAGEPVAPPAEAGQSNLLSDREQEVLTLVAEAKSNRQIAAVLSITEATVKRHLRNIFRKLDAVSRIDAVNKGIAAALIRVTR
ncbi:response regulator transcription factor [Kutzneria buriramensis]|uniref:DNA-binding NarL/FixJ family response regulator n=1 Tax=Kutzneria buriramensis TaxID=1045776 RepID=A0A3E0HKT8_9PSEU|nr:response regulator transcription factor [Kutzneria buriramensis]REH47027.1 DNA-binding NarL/FixJ family response regulator [Kutzneria buriramensis]